MDIQARLNDEAKNDPYYEGDCGASHESLRMWAIVFVTAIFTAISALIVLAVNVWSYIEPLVK